MEKSKTWNNQLPHSWNQNVKDSLTKILVPQKTGNACGKYKRTHRVIVVTVVVLATRTKFVERMGHIELKSSLYSYIWYSRGFQAKRAWPLWDMSRALEEVIYFAAYVVFDPKDTPLEHKSIATEREYREHWQWVYQGFIRCQNGCLVIQDPWNK